MNAPLEPVRGRADDTASDDARSLDVGGVTIGSSAPIVVQ